MSVYFSSQEKKATTTISPGQPEKKNTSCSGGNGDGAATSRVSRCRSWCRSFNDCLIMGLTVSSNRKPTNKPEQLAELEKEVKRQKELKAMYKMKLERTQDYLQYCLQMAQGHGFLDVIINNKENQEGIFPSNAFPVQANASPKIPLGLMQRECNLESLIVQAKINGWYIDPREIELQKKVGQGSTADIYKGIWRGLDVAVKCIYPDFFESNENGVFFFSQEVETLSRQRHRFVVQMLGVCLNPPEHGWIVTELLGITLKDWLHGPGSRRQQRMIPLPPLEERLTKALEIAQAIQYLHEQKPMLIHRDLKPSNVFLDDAGHVRVADFGHARFLADEEKALTGETGTCVYMAPEVIRCEPYSEKCDVYSFAIVLNELVTGDYPYIETDYGPSKIAIEVGDGKLRPALPMDNEEDGQSRIIKELIELIQLSWDESDAKRPSFATITHRLREIQKIRMDAFTTTVP